jgi:integrase
LVGNLRGLESSIPTAHSHFWLSLVDFGAFLGMSKWESVAGVSYLRRSPGGWFYARKKVVGKAVDVALKTQSLRTAKQRLPGVLAAMAEAARGPVARKDEVTLGDAISDWVAWKHGQTDKAGTQAYHREVAEIVRGIGPGDLLVHSITRQMVDRWWHGLRHWSATRANASLHAARAVVKLARTGGFRVPVPDPFEHLRRRRVMMAQRELPTREQWEAVLAWVRSAGQRWGGNSRAAAALELLAATGVRHGEYVALRWEDVREDRILVSGGAKGTKNHESRWVPITAPARAALDRCRELTGDKALVAPVGTPRKALNRGCEAVGCPPMRIHDLRHLFATRCLESGVDFATVARWMGHKDGGRLLARLYSHLRDDHSAAMAARVV